MVPAASQHGALQGRDIQLVTPDPAQERNDTGSIIGETDLAARILAAVRSVIPQQTEPVALHEPEFEGNEWSYVKECLDTRWVSSAGKFVDLFEKQLAEFTGVSRAVATVNGTAALHICLRLAGVEPGDEVLVPSLTFIATANAVSYAGAVPHFVDSEDRTLGIDAAKLDAYLQQACALNSGHCINKFTGARIRALVAMHVFGHPSEIDRLLCVCSKWSIALVEDAAESLGSYHGGTHTGNFGVASALSFNGNKVLTTGGGGAILTNDPALGAFAKHLTTTARLSRGWSFVHDYVGYNYRMPNLNAALGCAQLERLPGVLHRKRTLFERYAMAFRNVGGARLLAEPACTRSNYWLITLLLDGSEETMRDHVLQVLNDSGLMARPAWTLMHSLPMYATCPRMDLPCAEALERRIVNLPSSAFLAD